MCLEFPSTHLFSDLVDESWLFGPCLGLKFPERFSSNFGGIPVASEVVGMFQESCFHKKNPLPETNGVAFEIHLPTMDVQGLC